MVLDKCLTFLTETGQSLMGVADHGHWRIKALIWSQLPGEVFWIDSQANPNFIELILLNKSFKIPTVEQLEGKSRTRIFCHFMISENKGWGLGVSRSTTVRADGEDSLLHLLTADCFFSRIGPLKGDDIIVTCWDICHHTKSLVNHDGFVTIVFNLRKASDSSLILVGGVVEGQTKGCLIIFKDQGQGFSLISCMWIRKTGRLDTTRVDIGSDIEEIRHLCGSVLDLDRRFSKIS